MSDSIFTKIINGQVPSHRLYEDDECIIILDIRPIQPGHSLVIPKKQVEYIWDVDKDLYKHLWKVARKFALHQREVLASKRVSVIVDGESIPHVHIQLIPTNGADDLDAKRPDGEPDHDGLRAMAVKLKYAE